MYQSISIGENTASLGDKSLAYSVICRKKRCKRSSHDIADFRKLRKSIGLLVDPNKAEVICKQVLPFDPYGIGPKPPEEHRLLRPEYFARNAGTKPWVLFKDLPEATAKILFDKHAAMPAVAFTPALPIAA